MFERRDLRPCSTGVDASRLTAHSGDDRGVAMWDFIVLAIIFAGLLLFLVWVGGRDRRNRVKAPEETEPAAEQHRRTDG